MNPTHSDLNIPGQGSPNVGWKLAKVQTSLTVVTGAEHLKIISIEYRNMFLYDIFAAATSKYIENKFTCISLSQTIEQDCEYFHLL